jgi:hypothetical protein
MGKGTNDEIDYRSEHTFKQKLPKLYQIVVIEALRNGIELNTFDFLNCQNSFDIIDVNYTNWSMDFSLSVKGGERLGYRVLNSSLTESFYDEDDEDL